MSEAKVCSIEGCGKRCDAGGFCSGHWHRWRRHGDPLAGRAPVESPLCERFGRLFVVAEVGKDRLGKPLVRALCDCGSDRIYVLPNLRRGDTRSCGCLKSELTAQRAREGNRRHGHAVGGVRSPEYRAWDGMKDRCLNAKHPAYSNYGGRGITVCERWQGENGFANFFADLGPRPSPQHSLDRFPDMNGDYEPGNCRWATQSEQHENRRVSRLLTFQGETHCVTEWERRRAMGRGTLLRRLDRGWSIDRALTG